MDIRKMIVLGMFGGGGEKIAPTCAITTTVLDPTPTAAIPITFTWSEDVTGFAVADITLGNCTIGDLTAVSASVYTATITATATGTVTVDIAAGVCVDLAGNANTAATQFSMVYILSELFLMSDGVLYQEAAKTNLADANDDPVGCWVDASGNGRDFLAADTVRPLLKTNIIGGFPGILFDGSNDVLVATFNPTIGTPSGIAVPGGEYTLFILANGSAAASKGLFGNATYDPGFYSKSATGKVCTYDGTTRNFSVAADTNAHLFTFHREMQSVLKLYLDGILDGTTVLDANTWDNAVYSVGSDGNTAYFTSYIYGVILVKGDLSDAQVAAINAKLIEKKNNMIAASFTVNSSAVLVNDDENWFGNPTLTVM